jgi:hypothetical protein
MATGSYGPGLHMTATQDIPISLTLPKTNNVQLLSKPSCLPGLQFAFVNVLTPHACRQSVLVDLVPLGSVTHWTCHSA